MHCLGGWRDAARSYFSHAIEGNPRNTRQFIPSPGYIYGLAKSGDDCDSGSRISAALDILKSGALSIKAFPYSRKSCNAPTAADVAKASSFRIKSWSTVDLSSVDDVKGQLALSSPLSLPCGCPRVLTNSAATISSKAASVRTRLMPWWLWAMMTSAVHLRSSILGGAVGGTGALAGSTTKLSDPMSAKPM